MSSISVGVSLATVLTCLYRDELLHLIHHAADWGAMPSIANRNVRFYPMSRHVTCVVDLARLTLVV